MWNGGMKFLHLKLFNEKFTKLVLFGKVNLPSQGLKYQNVPINDVEERHNYT